MKRLSLIAFFVVACLAVEAQDTTAVKEAVDRLQKALVERDTVVMKQLLHQDLQFGHSNGWVQTKRDAIDDARSGALVYRQFDRQSITIQMFKKRAIVKERMEVKGARNGTEFNIKLFVLQQWVKTKKGWQLMMRQSAKQG
ncbi:MAG: nuclear transport factor 2 family protein [Chitinophagaceae bacterium]|nr:nuclear transport factor 2 family protein [Chitinophagaceae bacterium]